jgi:hypothetical protein
MFKGLLKKRISPEMAEVRKCDVQNCGYNMNCNCHAKAITVGDSSNPSCDTFMKTEKHTKETARIAGVGACKVSECRFNEDFECSADYVSVGFKEGKVNCLTFEARLQEAM